MNQNDKDAFEKYWHSTFEGMSSDEYIKYKDAGKTTTKTGFLAGIQYERDRQSEVMKMSFEEWCKRKMFEDTEKCKESIDSVPIWKA
ncbi:MAG: hypothetical protein HUM72_12565 [Dolichospermum sp.]|nr:hypothetical protein [Dolichospermum sp.]